MSFRVQRKIQQLKDFYFALLIRNDKRKNETLKQVQGDRSIEVYILETSFPRYFKVYCPSLGTLKINFTSCVRLSLPKIL